MPTIEDIDLKDHDILIATYTLQKELMRRFDDYVKANDELHKETSSKISEMGKSQIRVDGDITILKGMFSTLDERLDELEKKNIIMSAAAGIGALIAGAIAWLKS